MKKQPKSGRKAKNVKNNTSKPVDLPSAAVNPPYDAAILEDAGNGKVKYAVIPQGGTKGVPQLGTEDALRKKYGSKLYPDPTQGTSGPSKQTEVTKESLVSDLNTFDRRLVFAIDYKTGAVVYSMSAQNEHPLVDGMIFPKDPNNPKSEKVQASEIDDDKIQAVGSVFYGVPALMNTNAYINLQAAGGKGNNKYILDRPNQIRWYNVTEPGYGNGSGVQGSTVPTVAEIVSWSQTEENRYKFPYRYIDFAHCKFWQKIPNNYLITLRRYPFPVNDAVNSSEEARGEVKKEKLKPVATMITWLGNDTGNKISSVVGPIETGLKWKDIKSEIWEVTMSGSGAEVNNPAAGISKVLGFLQSGGEGTKTRQPGPTPPDPYNGGPYSNKIIGPVNVIDSTKGRDRGLVFKNEFSIVFEYTPRSIGGVNTKAAALDILGNVLLMTSATAPFWGGANRHMPHAGFGTADPFLGGAAGKAAWMRGDPEGFFNALKNQFSAIFDNVKDLFNKVMANPIEGLQEIAKGGVAEFMKMSTTHAKIVVQGMHSILTGAPVGEWHLCVGNPLNPIMVMGNMVCAGAKIEFSDELGPDDFPTEIKVTITLQHGMPRDKAGIESMFNKGRGRIYALPKGYESSFSSSGQSPVDSSIGSRTTYQRNAVSEENKKVVMASAALGFNLNLAYQRKYDPLNTSKAPVVGNVYGALYGHGYSNKAVLAKAVDPEKKTDKA